jgi:hypothetical protein
VGVLFQKAKDDFFRTIFSFELLTGIAEEVYKNPAARTNDGKLKIERRDRYESQQSSPAAHRRPRIDAGRARSNHRRN